MYDKAFTLSLIGPSTRLEEADLLLRRCWSLRAHANDVLQARLAALIASVCIQYKKYGEAHEWLDTGETLLAKANLEPSALARERTSLLYDRGENWLALGDYGSAQSVFGEMLQQAQLSDWQRSQAYAQNWLAYTAIFQEKFDLCEQYLHTGWTVANRIKEKRVIAYYKRTFAYYYRTLSKQDEALQWAETALDSFERLGMLSATDEMNTLIDDLAVA
jgi:hypothetical protein